MEKYNFHDIEEKWQKRWEEMGLYRVEEKSTKPKYYCLIEFPYPSGDGLHVGHPRSFTAMDIIARKRRMEGYNVLYPIGWDAFGLPAENYALKTGIHPSITTKKNADNFRRQLKRLGLSFDWSREVNTTDPEYYKWTQWMFLQFVKHDMAYKAKMAINWCPKDKIGLANEEVVNGCCERCGTPVEKREKEQWMIRITKYADRLIDDLDKVDYLPQIKEQQKNWIGRSEGAEIEFVLNGVLGQEDGKHTVKVFTTRPDTIFGATFLAISPELAKKWIEIGWRASERVCVYAEEALKREEMDRAAEGKEKTGVNTGLRAVNPATGEETPVWVADYVLGGYGTGAIMAVPAHDERDFEFAQKFDLPIKSVVIPVEAGIQKTDHRLREDDEKAFIGDGVAVNSGFLDGLVTKEAKEKITAWLEKEGKGKKAVLYKLRDWVFSRQRYWGEPIPMIHCNDCGWIPVSEKDLPVRLPEVEKYQPTDTGESPLANVSEWVNVLCSKCGRSAKRETDTMPNWAGSSWYFLRYCDPHNDQVFASKESLEYFMPVDWYNGGMEHVTLHLLYSRFWHKFLYDIGVIPKECGDEPYKKRTSHGLILGEGGEKMSKSRGNVVNPDEVVDRFGADAFRLYEMFMGPFDQPIPWDINGLTGCVRFLEKVWKLQEKISNDEARRTNNSITRLTHKTLKKVSEHIEEMRFNTAVSAMMILVNEMEKAESIAVADYRVLLVMLAPFAPHCAEELWEKLGEKKSIHSELWPKYDPNLIQEEEATIVVQVNGKVRDNLKFAAGISETEAVKRALASEKVKKYVEEEPKKIIFIPDKLINIVV